MFVVQYQYLEWNELWEFIGIFTDELLARQWVECQLKQVTWRKSLPGEMKGNFATGISIRKYGPERFNVMEVEPNDLIGRTF